MFEVTFYGETFNFVDNVGDFALMEFAESAERVDTESLAGLAAIMRLLKAAVVEDEWTGFQATARKNKATVEACMKLVMEVFEREADRPTVRPSGSSDGPPPTAGKSVDVSSLRVAQRLEGRPDLQLMVLQAAEARSA